MFKHHPYISFGDKCIITGTLLFILVVCFMFMQC